DRRHAPRAARAAARPSLGGPDPRVPPGHPPLPRVPGRGAHGPVPLRRGGGHDGPRLPVPRVPPHRAVGDAHGPALALRPRRAHDGRGRDRGDDPPARRARRPRAGRGRPGPRALPDARARVGGRARPDPRARLRGHAHGLGDPLARRRGDAEPGRGGRRPLPGLGRRGARAARARARDHRDRPRHDGHGSRRGDLGGAGPRGDLHPRGRPLAARAHGQPRAGARLRGDRGGDVAQARGRLGVPGAGVRDRAL
ncbi:MAG: cyclase family protein, partial [uncultured Solirubrobacteraceae bacterium]